MPRTLQCAALFSEMLRPSRPYKHIGRPALVVKSALARPRLGASREFNAWIHRRVHPNAAVKYLHAVERLALRAVAPRRAARRLRRSAAGNDSGRPLCADGVVAA